MTRILIIYKDNLLTTATTAAVPLGRRGEDVTLGSTLDTVHVIIRMENSDTGHHSEKNGAVHLTDRETIQTNECDENKLDEG
jgi:hypothetical protein